LYLRTNFDPTIKNPDRDVIERVIRDLWKYPEEDFAVLSVAKKAGMFLQIRPGIPGTDIFYVEYGNGEGSLFKIEGVSTDEIIRLFQSFNDGDTSWTSDQRWKDANTGADGNREFFETLEGIVNKTGRTLDEWVAVITSGGLLDTPADRSRCREWLRTEFGLTAEQASSLVMWTGITVGVTTDERGVLADRCLASLRNNDLTEMENCRREVAELRPTFDMTDKTEAGWAELFDNLIQQMQSALGGPSLKDGVMYLLKAGPYYKIGNSINFEQRLNQIKLQLPYPVEEIHQIATDDPKGLEAYWHKRFDTRRTNGEWFLLTDEDIGVFTSRDHM